MNDRLLLDLERPLIDPDEWILDPSLTFLNHGSFGACPRSILKRQTQQREHMERSPVRFNLTILPKLAEAARESLAPLLGTSPTHFVFVSNASEGVSTALNAVEWQAGDEVIISQDSYPACRHMLSALAQRYSIIIKVASTPFGGDHWKRRVVAAFDAQVSKRTKLLLIDHITSPTALVYPVEDLVQLAKDIGAISLVDGAHVPGQQALNLDRLKPDFYVGNTHKWMMTPKSCAILYANEQWRSRLLPHVISHGYLAQSDSRLHALFDWTGTRDYTAMVCVPDTIEWVNQRCGGFESLRDRNHRLTLEARTLLMSALWSHPPPLMPPPTAIAQMAAIPLPERLAAYPENALPSSILLTESSASAGRIHPLQRALWSEGFEVPIIVTAHGVMLRISTQAYNYLQEYRCLANTLFTINSSSGW